MDKCLVLESFSGPDMNACRGQEILMPHDMALSFQRLNVVKILGEEVSPKAFETAVEARTGETTKVEKEVKQSRAEKAREYLKKKK